MIQCNYLSTMMEIFLCWSIFLKSLCVTKHKSWRVFLLINTIHITHTGDPLSFPVKVKIKLVRKFFYIYSLFTNKHQIWTHAIMTWITTRFAEISCNLCKFQNNFNKILVVYWYCTQMSGRFIIPSGSNNTLKSLKNASKCSTVNL